MGVSAQSVSARAAAVPDSSIAPVTGRPADKQATATISPPQIDLVAPQAVSAAGPKPTAPSNTDDPVQGVLASFVLGPLATDHGTPPVDSPMGGRYSRWCAVAGSVRQ
jgi:hypothetical protein